MRIGACRHRPLSAGRPASRAWSGKAEASAKGRGTSLGEMTAPAPIHRLFAVACVLAAGPAAAAVFPVGPGADCSHVRVQEALDAAAARALATTFDDLTRAKAA